MPITDPLDLANCVLWLDASQEVFADGTGVGTWTDRSGAGNHASQTTAAARPLFKTGIQNGLPALLFDGSNDCMGLPAGVFNLHAGTSFAVARSTTHSPTGGRPGRYILGFRTSGGSRWYMNQDTLTGTTSNFATQVGSSYFGTGAADLTFHAWWLRANGNAKDSRVSCIGSSSGFDSATGTTIFNGGVGSLGGVQEWWQGYIAEVVHYSRALSISETHDVYRYLCDKWGLSPCLGGPTVGSIGFGTF